MSCGEAAAVCQAVQAIPVSIPPNPPVSVASTLSLPYSTASIPAIQTTPVAIPPKPQVPVASTLSLPYSTTSIPAIQTTPVAIPPKPPVPVASTSNIPYSFTSTREMQASAIPIQPRPAIPLPVTNQTLVPVPAQSISSMPVQVPVPIQKTIPYSTFSQPVINQNIVPAQTIATLPNPTIAQNPQIIPQTIPLQNIQHQVQNLPYQTASFNPLIKKNITAYSNMSRPNTYSVSSYRPNLGGKLPLYRRLGGITNNTVGNMTAPGKYSTKTYNARKL